MVLQFLILVLLLINTAFLAYPIVKDLYLSRGAETATDDVNNYEYDDELPVTVKILDRMLTSINTRLQHIEEQRHEIIPHIKALYFDLITRERHRDIAILTKKKFGDKQVFKLLTNPATRADLNLVEDRVTARKDFMDRSEGLVVDETKNKEFDQEQNEATLAYYPNSILPSESSYDLSEIFSDSQSAQPESDRINGSQETK